MRISATIFGAILVVIVSAPLQASDAGGEASSQAATQPTSQPAPVSPPKAGEYLTEAQLVQAYKAGQFQLVVQETGRIRSNPKALAGMNEFNLLVLRAESYLQLRNQPSAMAVFGQAAVFAPDAHKKALMEATALLLKRSVGLKYSSYNADDQGQPRVAVGPNQRDGRVELGTAVTFDLLQLGHRIAALRALYADEYVKTAEAVRRISFKKAMPEVTPAFASLDELAMLETAVNDRQNATQELRNKAAGAVQKLIDAALATMRTRIEELSNLSKTTVDVPIASRGGSTSPTVYPGGAIGSGSVTSIKRQRGLLSREADELDGMIETGQRMEAETAKIAERLRVEAKLFEKEVKDGADVQKVAHDLLESTTIYGTRNNALQYKVQH